MEALKKIVARAGSGHWERTAKGEYYRREDPITDAMIAGHLDGSRPIGINIVSDPDAKKTHFIILDFDDHTGKTKPELMASRVGAVAGYLMQMKIAHSVVKSGGGRGYHIWIILEKAVGCQYALDKGKELLERGQEVLRRIWPNESFTVGTGGLFARDGIHEVEVFPKGTARMYNVALPLARASVALVGTLDNRGFATFDAGELEIQLVPPSKPGKKSDGPSVSVDRDAAFAAFIKRYDVDNYDHWGSAALCLIAAFGKGDDWAREQWESWSRTGTSFKAGDEAKWDKAGAARFSPITFWLYAKEGGYNGAHPYNTTEQRKLTALSFLDGVRLLRDEVGTAYAELAPRHFVPVQSSEFRNRVALGLHRDKNIIPDETILKSVAILTEAQASETKAERVWLRFGQAGGKRYLFLADDDCTVIEIDDSGWRVADDAPAVFRRGDCLPMPMPVSAPLSDLTEFLNVDVDNMPFLLAWMVTALYFPGGQCPIALLDGPAGSGKSCALRTVIATIDPKVGAQSGEPKSEDDLFAAAYNAGTVSGDNFSSMAKISDPLCRLSTGGGIRKRKLYTDHDVVSLDVKRPILIAGIDPTFYANDLAERIIRIALHRPDTYLNDRQFDAKLEEKRARFTGAILDLVVACLNEAKDVDGDFRFATYVAVGEVVAQRLGHEAGWFTADMVARAAELAAEVADGDCVFEFIARMIASETDGRLEMTAKQLFDVMQEQIRLGEIFPPRDDVPRNPKQMGGRLSRIIPILKKEHFITVTRGSRRSFIFEWDTLLLDSIQAVLDMFNAGRVF